MVDPFDFDGNYEAMNGPKTEAWLRSRSKDVEETIKRRREKFKEHLSDLRDAFIKDLLELK